jgi:hypothetical protein
MVVDHAGDKFADCPGGDLLYRRVKTTPVSQRIKFDGQGLPDALPSLCFCEPTHPTTSLLLSGSDHWGRC